MSNDDVLVSTETLGFPPGFTPHTSHGITPTPLQQHAAVAMQDKFAARPGLHPSQVQVAGTLAASVPQPAAPEPKAFVIATPLTDSDRSAEYLPVQLPSGFLYYPFKHLSVKLVRGVQQAKLVRAAKEGSTRLTVEAITSLLGDGINAADLTVPDFFYVMYWLRLASYTAYPFNHVARCSNVKHLADVGEGKKPAASLQTIHQVTRTNLVETTLAAYPAVPELVVASGLRLKPHTMKDVIDIQDLPDAEDHAEREYLAEIASMLSPSQEGEWLLPTGSFEERMELAGRLPADLTRAILQEWSAACASYGVTESIVVKCQGCGAEIKTDVSISAPNFS